MIGVCPSYVGHMFNNSKDVTFAVGYVWSLYLTIKILYSPRQRWPGQFILLGLVAGITMGIRVGGLVIFPLLIAAYIPIFLMDIRHPGKQATENMARFGFGTLGAFWLAYIVMIFGWPWAQQNVLKFPFDSLQVFTHFDNHYDADRWYIVKCMAIKLPEFLLCGLAFSIILGVAMRKLLWHKALSPDMRHHARLGALYCVALFFIWPVAYVIMCRSNLYNEMRHMLFVVMPMVAWMAVLFTGSVRRMSPASAAGMIGGLVLLLSLPAIAIGRLYPYQYIYCNLFGGGMRGLGKAHTSDYYLHSYRELAGQLTNYLKQRDGDQFPNRVYTVYAYGSSECLSYYLPSNILAIRWPQKAEFCVYSVGEYEDNVRTKIVGQVTRCGVTLSRIQAYEHLLTSQNFLASYKRPLDFGGQYFTNYTNDTLTQDLDKSRLELQQLILGVEDVRSIPERNALFVSRFGSEVHRP